MITGCAGFIGSHLVNNLYKNHKLILVDDLRHTLATHAAILTKDISMVQQSLDHTTLKMTQKYAHFLEEDQIFTNNIVSNKIYSLL